MLIGSLRITEVCSNPPDETAGEFIEIFNDSASVADVSGFSVTDGDALDGLQGWSGSFPHGGVILESTQIPPGGYAILLEEGYVNDPWLSFQPGTVILTTGDNAICNGLAASSDPLTLFDDGGTGPENVLSTFGTPVDAELWENRDDDGLDSIPYDPGEGSSLFRYPLNLPDSQEAWFTGEPTPGGPPDAPPDTFVITIDSLYLSETDPIPGTGVHLYSVVSCWGTVSPDSGYIELYIDSDGDSTAQSDELLLSIPASSLQPGVSDTLQAFFTAPEQGWYPGVCSSPQGEKRVHFTTGGGINPVITEIMANPLNEDTEEYIEVFYPGPGVFPLGGCSFTDGDAVDETVPFLNGEYVQSMGTALIIDPEYGGTLAIPQGTPLFTPSNTTVGNGLTTDDPILLYKPGGNSLEFLLATAGTPILSDDPLQCDDDGLDGIPFDPGDGCSMERIIPEGPDQEYNWRASPPGGTPGSVPEDPGWTDLATDTVSAGAMLTGVFSNIGVFEAEGLVTFFSDTNGDLTPDPSETIHQQSMVLLPGQTDSLELPFALPDSGLFTVAATIRNPLDTLTANDTGFCQYIPEKPAWPVVTEVLCNPENEDCDEFVEIFFPGPGQVDLTCFRITDNDSEDALLNQSTRFLTQQAYGLILDPEYQNGSQPYDIPPGTPVFYPGNTTIGDGLSGTDPILLLHDSVAVSQYGTPEDPGDGIPFDPGTGLSVERIAPWLPDGEASWFSSPLGPTPGGPPENLTEGVDYAVVSLEAQPPMGPSGTVTTVSAGLLSMGTDSVTQGELLLTVTAGSETILQCTPAIPGLEDTVTVSASWVSQGNGVTLQAMITCQEDQQQQNDTGTAVWNPPPGLCINEIFCQEPEWLELCNASQYPVDLCSITVSDPSSSALLEEVLLEPGDFAVVTADLSDFTAMWGEVPCQVIEPANWPTLNNGGDSLFLSSPGTVLDLVPYLSSWGGSQSESLERRSRQTMGFLEENWGTCIQGGTPGRANSIGETAGKDFLTLSPVVFNPPATPLRIEVSLPMQACNVTVKVYDVRGMELERPYDGIVPGEVLVLQWVGNGYPVGRYIIYAEANCAGEILTDAAVVVLARPLR